MIFKIVFFKWIKIQLDVNTGNLSLVMGAEKRYCERDVKKNRLFILMVYCTLVR